MSAESEFAGLKKISVLHNLYHVPNFTLQYHCHNKSKKTEQSGEFFSLVQSGIMKLKAEGNKVRKGSYLESEKFCNYFQDG